MPEALNSNSHGSVRGRSISRSINTAGVGVKRLIATTDVTVAIGV